MGEEEEDEAERVYHERRAVIEMLEMRGHTTLEVDVKMTLDEFRRTCVNRDSGELNYDSTSLSVFDPSLKVWWIGTREPLNAREVLRYCTSRVIETYIQWDSTIFITREGITDDGRQCLMDLNNAGHVIEFFTHTELFEAAGRYYATGAIAKHEVVRADEKSALLKLFNMREEEFPSIRADSLFARYHGLRKGELLKTAQYMPTATCVVTYRLGV